MCSHAQLQNDQICFLFFLRINKYYENGAIYSKGSYQNGEEEGEWSEDEDQTSSVDLDEINEIEGVFLVNEGRVSFTPVNIGIAGQEYFEVLSGLSAGDIVVAGPYQQIRDLIDGDAVRGTDVEDGERDGQSGASFRIRF